MFAKIAAVILALGVCACSLLALRQARLQAANELAEARLRVRSIDERVSLVRAGIAASVVPSEVEHMTAAAEDIVGPLVPLALRDQLEAPDAPGSQLVEDTDP
ncbi:MAG TPA: hypothetical protein VFF69_10870 [Phycisphaerales bacterium]|nr:hypothetical protein [Phycisphaerales bacterium]